MKTYQEFDINYFQDEDGMFNAEVCRPFAGASRGGRRCRKRIAMQWTPSKAASKRARKVQ